MPQRSALDILTPTYENSVPNLDGMSVNELRKFRKKYARPSMATAMRLVGIRSNAVDLARRLAAYAFCKSKAMTARAKGDLRRAIPEENMCESLYHWLPDDLKW